jgi:hypothetical protein
VKTLGDLRWVKVADVEELKTTLKLTPVEIKKLSLPVREEWADRWAESEDKGGV